MRRSYAISTAAACVAAIIATRPALTQQPAGSPAAKSAETLGAIVGVWQSDTTDGTSARSSCAWTPSHSAVLCEQTINTPGGAQHAIDLFTFDAAQGRYVFYLLGKIGDTMRPVPLAIDGKVWIYGGETAGPDGRSFRTINDFSGGDTYTWRVESKTSGGQWTPGAHGKSTRVR